MVIEKEERKEEEKEMVSEIVSEMVRIPIGCSTGYSIVHGCSISLILLHFLPKK